MPSLYLITNQEKVFVYSTVSGPVLPGSPESGNLHPIDALRWLPIKNPVCLGPAGFFWENSQRVYCYHCPVSDNQASVLTNILSPIHQNEAWRLSRGVSRFALQLVIDENFLSSLGRDIELYVLDRISASKECTLKQLAEELGLDIKETRRGLDEMESRNLISFWTRKEVYRTTSLGEEYLDQYGWTPENKSTDVAGLPVNITVEGSRFTEITDEELAKEISEAVLPRKKWKTSKVNLSLSEEDKAALVASLIASDQIQTTNDPEKVCAVVSTLTPRKLDVAYLWYVEKLGTKDIAEKLAVSMGSVSVARTYIKNHFKDAFSDVAATN